MRIFLLSILTAVAMNAADAPLRVAVGGLVHGHVDGFFHSARSRTDIEIVGIFEPDEDLQKQYAAKYHFAPSIFFTNPGQMLDQVKPEALAIFTSTYDHPLLVEEAAARHVPVMMEKPMAVSVEHAHRIQRAAAQGGIPVIVNYETTWYRSHAAIWKMFKEQNAAGEIHKMVAMDGHEGPKEIHVGPEFLKWLTDPVKNGAGALFDFGCYGANLMTWLMDNQRPVSVRATTQTFKPGIYAKVDDEANVLVEYPNAIGIIEGSWNWPYSRKDLEVYAQRGYAVAVGGNTLRTRVGAAQTQEETSAPPELPEDQRDSISYLKAVVRGRVKPSGLSSIENNMIVVEILEAARESARSGKAIRLGEGFVKTESN